jgi:uncharacterized protein (TIGR02597 family)
MFNANFNLSTKKLWRLPQHAGKDTVQTQNTQNKKFPLITRKIKLHRNTMNTITLGLRSLAAGLVLAGTIAVPQLSAVDAFSDPVGYHSLSITGASDNVMSLPMVRDSVFAGTVAGSITANSFTVNAGTNPPTWTANQFVYSAGIQGLTYYVEFTSGPLQGLYYKIESNGTASLTLDTEGDNLTNHPLIGNPTAALAAGNSIKIRPYWRVRDVFQVGANPIIEPRPNAFTVKDDILIPNYASVGANKAPSTILYFETGVGWQSAGDEGVDYGDHILRPSEAFIVRRRNAAGVSLTNLGSVLLNKSITFVPGGNGALRNDTYISITRPEAVTLDASGLRNADQNLSLIKDSPNDFTVTDQLFAFGAATGFNRAPSRIFYYLAGAGGGWREVGDEDNTTIGTTVSLEPGKAYIVRKAAANSGRDWINDPNY